MQLLYCFGNYLKHFNYLILSLISQASLGSQYIGRFKKKEYGRLKKCLWTLGFTQFKFLYKNPSSGYNYLDFLNRITISKIVNTAPFPIRTVFLKNTTLIGSCSGYWCWRFHVSHTKHQEIVELLTKKLLGAEWHCQLLHGPDWTTRETKAREEASEWRPLNHPQQVWCQ